MKSTAVQFSRFIIVTVSILQCLLVLIVPTCDAFKPISNRIVIGGKVGTIDSIAKTFRPYGKIQEISLHGQAEPYAFVTFVKPEAAEAALQHHSPHFRVKVSQQAVEKPVHLNSFGNFANLEKWEAVLDMAQKTNTMIRVVEGRPNSDDDHRNHNDNSSVLEGVLEDIRNSESKTTIHGILPIATTNTEWKTNNNDDYGGCDDSSEQRHRIVRPTESIVFLDTPCAGRQLSLSKPGTEMFPGLRFLARGGSLDLAQRLWDLMETIPAQRLEIRSFPPSLGRALLSALEEFRPPNSSKDFVLQQETEGDHDNTNVQPRRTTLPAISVVELTKDGDDKAGGLFKIGLPFLTAP